MQKNPINSYINKVTKNMGSKQQKEVFKELKTHILDSADELAAEKNVKVDEIIITEVINRMGPAEKLAEMYPEEKTFKDKINNTIKGLAKFTLTFVIMASIIWIALWLYFRDVQFNTTGFIVTFIIYIILLILHPISHMKMPSKMFNKRD